MNSDADNSFLKSRSGLPGLLFWQKLLLAFVLGILSIKWFFPALVAFLIYIFILLVFRLEKGAVFLLLLVYALGHWYADFSMPAQSVQTPDWMARREKVQLQGEVHSVQALPGSSLKILLSNVVCNSSSGQTHLEGYLKWTWNKPDEFPYAGQLVSMKVRIKPTRGLRNSGLWDYGFYSRSKNIFYRTYTRGPIKQGGLKPYEPDFLQKLRSSFSKHILQNAPPGQGGTLFPALLTGDRFYLSPDTVELIRRAGVSHVLALSGLHVGFIASIGFGLAWLVGLVAPGVFLKIPRLKLGVILAAPLVVFYLWLGQFSPSLLRASCMFGFWGVLMLMNRGRVLVDGLFLAVALILGFAPLSAFDLGFQLSVLAVAGIAYFYPLFHRLLPEGRNIFVRAARFVLAVLAVSVCANVVLLPVLVWNFGVVSPNLLFNLLFVPLLGMFLMPICGVGGLVASFFSPGVASKLFDVGAACFDLLLSAVRKSVDYGVLPECASYRPLWEDMLIYYLLLGIILLGLSMKRDKLKFLLMPLLLLLCIRFYGMAGEHGVRMDLLDTGQSQCVVISGPHGSRTVVDGGGGFGDGFDMGRSVVGPWLCSGHLPQIDHIFMTHGDRDHAGGLAFLLEKFSVGGFYTNGDRPAGKVGLRFEKAFAQKGIDARELARGEIIELEPGLVIEVLHPDRGFKGSKNDRSLFLRLLWEGRPLLIIAGDLDKKGVRSVLDSGLDLKSDVLILPHHGSAGSFSPQLYEKVGPDLALAACGYLNHFKFVAEKVRLELVKRNINLYTTASKGMISIVWDREKMTMLTP